MKFRILLFSLTTVAIGAAAWYSYNGGCNQDNIANAYIPRSQFQSAQGIKGAFEYYKAIKVTKDNQLIIWGIVTYVIKRV